jgi:hypothetical protein
MNNIYIYDYLNKGLTKFVFTAGVYPRNRMIEYKNLNNDVFSLEVEQLQQIYIGIYDIKKVQKPSLGSGISVVVSCIMTNTPKEYRDCIENIRLQERFYSYQMATKIYGIVIMEEVKTLVSQKEPSSEKAIVEPNEIIEYEYHRWNITDDRESDFDRFLSTTQLLVDNGFKKTFFVFQERCDFDVIKYVQNEIKKKTSIWDGMYLINSEFETIVDKIDDNMTIHVKKYIEHGYIDTDYKPGNVCIIQSTGSASASATSASATISSSQDEQIWTGFDFDIHFVHDIKGLDKSFKKKCELYMIIQFYITFSYIVVSYREHFVPIILEILQTKHKITNKTINDIVYYFYNINTHFIEQYTTEYNKDIFTPYRSLLEYASRYFTKNILNTLDPVEQERINDEQKHNTPKYVVNAICAIFRFVGTPKSSPVSSPKSSPVSSPKSSPVSSPKFRKSSSKPGGRKVNSSKKHLNKRASTNTNAITKKSKSKRALVK